MEIGKDLRFVELLQDRIRQRAKALSKSAHGSLRLMCDNGPSLKRLYLSKSVHETWLLAVCAFRCLI